jgi:hypothetical protein
MVNIMSDPKIISCTPYTEFDLNYDCLYSVVVSLGEKRFAIDYDQLDQ